MLGNAGWMGRAELFDDADQRGPKWLEPTHSA
jgi:hypothetical protein